MVGTRSSVLYHCPLFPRDASTTHSCWSSNRPARPLSPHRRWTRRFACCRIRAYTARGRLRRRIVLVDIRAWYWYASGSLRRSLSRRESPSSRRMSMIFSRWATRPSARWRADCSNLDSRALVSWEGGLDCVVSLTRKSSGNCSTEGLATTSGYPVRCRGHRPAECGYPDLAEGPAAASVISRSNRSPSSATLGCGVGGGICWW
jgi:hypothetical protein